MLQFTLHLANSVVVNSDQLWQYSLEAHKFKGIYCQSYMLYCILKACSEHWVVPLESSNLVLPLPPST